MKAERQNLVTVLREQGALEPAELAAFLSLVEGKDISTEATRKRLYRAQSQDNFVRQVGKKWEALDEKPGIFRR